MILRWEWSGGYGRKCMGEENKGLAREFGGFCYDLLFSSFSIVDWILFLADRRT